MKFENKNSLLDFLEVGEVVISNNKKSSTDPSSTSYKGYDIRNLSLFMHRLQNEIKKFKVEFQENELKDNFEVYAERLIIDLKDVLNGLEQYLESDLYLNISKHIEMLTHSSLNDDEINQELEEHFKHISNHKLNLVEYMIGTQIDSTKEIIEIINSSKAHKNKSTGNIVLDNEDLSLGSKETLPNKPKKNKIHFDGSKIDLILLFLALHEAEIMNFSKRKDLEVFLENNFTYRHGDSIKDVSAVDSEISEILKPLKDAFMGSREKRPLKAKQRKTREVVSSITAKLIEIETPSEKLFESWSKK